MTGHTITVLGTTNTVEVTNISTLVAPQIVDNTVSVSPTPVTVQGPGDGATASSQPIVHTLTIDNPAVSLTLSETPVAVSVQSAIINVVTGGIQGPQGPPGLTGDELLLTKTERKDLVEDSPATGDITVYHGTAAIGSADGDAVWLISRKILTKDGGLFDIAKLYASSTENQIWNNRLGLSYT